MATAKLLAALTELAVNAALRGGTTKSNATRPRTAVTVVAPVAIRVMPRTGLYACVSKTKSAVEVDPWANGLSWTSTVIRNVRLVGLAAAVNVARPEAQSVWVAAKFSSVLLNRVAVGVKPVQSPKLPPVPISMVVSRVPVLRGEAPLTVITCEQFRQGVTTANSEALTWPVDVEIVDSFPAAWQATTGQECPPAPDLRNAYFIWGPDPTELNGTTLTFPPGLFDDPSGQPHELTVTGASF